ncbi:hypothetical protein PGT21_014742 [Puccinia graminis f. sp. tritici]|uniref:Uncharacterized protein n=1 Tax=Puccinia graminis f. sp. tritici TaxID=56615 RepID=A0A5B0S0I3_PUCGR|nr:hypothetical protein PGT21_014742 [Puccinia graminis f. sp. tritici]KAA1130563.1 hypothetical protein PGTUg99_022920 [Puccinia graminis f. sp. tritici]
MQPIENKATTPEAILVIKKELSSPEGVVPPIPEAEPVADRPHLVEIVVETASPPSPPQNSAKAARTQQSPTKYSPLRPIKKLRRSQHILNMTMGNGSIEMEVEVDNHHRGNNGPTQGSSSKRPQH